MNLWLALGLAVLVLAIPGLGFSETVLAQMGVNRLRKLMRGDNGTEEFTLDEQVRLLSTILMLRLFCILALGGVIMLASLQMVRLAALAESEALAVQIAMFVTVGLGMVFLDTVARRHARAKAQESAAPILNFFRRTSVLLSPIISLVFAITSPLSPARAWTAVTTLEDLQDEVLDLRSQGILKDTQSEIFQSLLDFGDTIAREVMVPRVDMVCCPLGMPFGEVLQQMNEHGYSRLPIYRETIDEIIGFVHVKDLIVHLSHPQRPLAEEDLREVLVVPGTRKIGEILRDFQAQNRSLAVVLDEYGGTDGLLTVEDIVEEIVGDINDEYDDDVAEIEHLNDGSAMVDAKMIVEDVNDYLDVDIPTEGSETLGGYLYEVFGHAPQIGESVEVDGVRFSVEGVLRRRITWVRIEKFLMESSPVRKERVA